MKKESAFQSKLINDIKKRWPGSLVMKNDPNYIQGIPDLTVLYKDRWALLECKRSSNGAKQKNQDKYVEKCNEMSFSRFVYPENRDSVLDELEVHFNGGR